MSSPFTWPGERTLDAIGALPVEARREAAEPASPRESLQGRLGFRCRLERWRQEREARLCRYERAWASIPIWPVNMGG